MSELKPSEEEIEKIAQRRGVLQWLKEHTNIPRQTAELFSKVYSAQMKKLREVDDVVRYLARGLKPNLKQSKRAFKDGRYIDVAHFVGNINDILHQIGGELRVLSEVKADQAEDFFDYYEHADLAREYFVPKTAGILDILKKQNRGRAARLLEKIYSTELLARKRNVNELVGKTDAIIDFTLDRFRDMAEARAEGNVAVYVSSLETIVKKHADFEQDFKNIYSESIAPLITRQKEKRVEEEETKPKRREPPPVKEVPDLEVPPAPSSTVAAPPSVRKPTGPKALPSGPVAPLQLLPKPEEPVAAPKPEPIATPVIQEQSLAPEHEEYEMPEWLLAPVPSAQYIEIERDEKGKAKSTKKSEPMLNRWVKLAYLHSDKTKEGTAKNLLVYSEKFDKHGDADSSLKLLALAEGLVHD